MVSRSILIEQLHGELTGDILPFWMKYLVDRDKGGFYGALTNDLQVHDEVPRSSVFCARMLWTYSAAYRLIRVPEYLEMARWAYEDLRNRFWDAEYEGLFWQVDGFHNGANPALLLKHEDNLQRKHHYAQAFGIYGLTEYYRVTAEPQALAMAQRLFGLLEEHAYDPVMGGYIEGSSRTWEALEDMRLSERDLNCRKSMNTMLHVLEAYTNLLRVWEDAHLKAQQRALLVTFLEHIIDPQTNHFRLFFDDDWNTLTENFSYGHDIEGSWLLVEAANSQGEAALEEHARQATLKMAQAVLEEGIDDDGSVFYEGHPCGLVDGGKSWWVQAEALVGFYRAYQSSGQDRFLQAAWRCWSFIQDRMIDRRYGEWYKQLDRGGNADLAHYKAGPWECPYHQSRACMEIVY
jgi:mannobiose 2-epimerase